MFLDPAMTFIAKCYHFVYNYKDRVLKMNVNHLETKLGCLVHCRQSQVSKGCGNRRHSTTSFSKNVVIAETSYQ